jgi:hypothetical protein
MNPAERPPDVPNRQAADAISCRGNRGDPYVYILQHQNEGSSLSSVLLLLKFQTLSCLVAYCYAQNYRYHRPDVGRMES